MLDAVAEEDRSEEDPSEEPGWDTGSEDEDVGRLRERELLADGQILALRLSRT